MIYNMGISQSTPLRSALREVGEYFDADDGSNGGIGTAPWGSEDDGGGCQQSFAIVMTDGYYTNENINVGNVDGGEGDPYEDNYSNTLADVAMLYYDTDLSDDLPDEVPTNSCDDNNQQHLVTYSVAFGVRGTLTPTDADGDGVEDDPCFLSSDTPSPNWPNPGSGKAEKIDDLWHAAVNGRGEFFSADSADELVNALKELFENIASRTGSGASVAVSGEEVGSDFFVYQTQYNSDTWTGDVYAFPVDSHTGEIAAQESWTAAGLLQDVDQGARRIVTYDGDDGGVPFNFSDLTDDQKSALGNNSDLVAYIRGEEIDGFRERTSKLGDIVHAAPLLVGDTLFVGGNDGMLHAFDAETGDERFAYVPNLVFDNLSNLAETDFSHLFYVDATPYSRAGVGDSDKTLLVGGLGKGGKGYYCLDVTDADDIDYSVNEISVADMVQWEYPQSGGDDDMGYSFSMAYIVRSNLEDSPWVVIFSNGYESVNGSAVLYVLNAEDGSLITRIVADSGSDDCNGLSTPVIIDVDNDNQADYVYAGDLKGNLWKFDLTSSDNVNDWDVAYKDGDGAAMPLFTASYEGEGQPITSRPDVMRHPDYHGYLVIFGTGQYLAADDRLDESQQSVYGIWDYGDDEDDSEYLGSIESHDSGELSSGFTLQKQEVFEEANCGDEYRVLTDNEVQWEETDEDGNPTGLTEDEIGQNPDPAISAGWFFDFPNDGDNVGERVIKDVTIRSDRAIVLSFIPDTSLCSGGGNSWFYILDAATGGRTEDAQMDISGNGEIDGFDVCGSDDGDDGDETGGYPPTGTKMSGMVHESKIATIDEDVDRAYVNTSNGTVQEVNIKGENLGIYYWRER
jgi:Tfp pilus tip-associated adhesin PilY1